MRMTKSLGLNKVKPGQKILAAYGDQDVLILKNYEVTETKDLERLKKLGVSRVVVEEESEKETVKKVGFISFNNLRSRMEQASTNTEKNEILYRHTVHNLKHIFSKVSEHESVELESLLPFAEELVRQIDNDPVNIAAMTQLEDYDFDTYRHSMNVAVLLALYERRHQSSRENSVTMALAGFYHDIGKIFIPNELINKAGALSSEEYSIVKTHPLWGEELLEEMGANELLRQVAREHHERPDGSGYPDGIIDVSPVSLRAGVFDVYDALVSKRSYKARQAPDHAFKLLYDEFKGWDESREALMDLFRFIGIYPVGSLVKLTDGSVGVVNANHPGRASAPVISVIVDENGKAVKNPYLLDLLRTEQQKVLRNGKIYDDSIKIYGSVSIDEVKEISEPEVQNTFRRLNNHQLFRLQ